MVNGDKILNELFTPFYFLSPHLYIEILNEKFPNQCYQIFDYNKTMSEYENGKEDLGNDNDDERNKNNTHNLRNIQEKIYKNPFFYSRSKIKKDT